jgi:hypothetical protein
MCQLKKIEFAFFPVQNIRYFFVCKRSINKKKKKTGKAIFSAVNFPPKEKKKTTLCQKAITAFAL